MKLIKLTDRRGQTYGDTQWGENVTHRVEWSGNFCQPGVIHCYRDLTLALFLNPIHGNFDPVRAWEAEGEILASDNGLKEGVAELTTIREITPLVLPTIEQCVKFGIYGALAVYHEAQFVAWANDWLSGKDRSREAAAATATAAAAVAAKSAVAKTINFDLVAIAAKAMSE